jgi:hypothetical protein
MLFGELEVLFKGFDPAAVRDLALTAGVGHRPTLGQAHSRTRLKAPR